MNEEVSLKTGARIQGPGASEVTFHEILMNPDLGHKNEEVRSKK